MESLPDSVFRSDWMGAGTGNAFGVALLIPGNGEKPKLWVFRERRALYDGKPFQLKHKKGALVPYFRCFSGAQWDMRGDVVHVPAAADLLEMEAAVPDWVARLPAVGEDE